MWWDSTKNSKQDAGLGAGVSWAALVLWCRLPDVWMQRPSWVSVLTSFAASGRNDLTETLSLLSVPNVTTCCCYWRSLYIPDTFFLAALADDVFGGESFRELPFSFPAPTLSSQCCQHQVSTIISSIQHEVTPTLLPQSSSFCDYSVTPSLQLWPHRPFLVLDVKPTTRGHDLRMELFSFTCRLS